MKIRFERRAPVARGRMARMATAYLCSNPGCGTLHRRDPMGSCPACRRPDGSGWSAYPVEAKECPKCGALWPPERLLMKCVVCESVYCPACKDVPSVHPFWCHEDRAAPGGTTIMNRYIQKMEEARRLEAKMRAAEGAKKSTPPAAAKESVPVMGIWLRTRGDRVQVLVETGGQWRLVHDQPFHAPEDCISAIAEPGGILGSPVDKAAGED
jgi:hypothetical protein